MAGIVLSECGTVAETEHRMMIVSARVDVTTPSHPFVKSNAFKLPVDLFIDRPNVFQPSGTKESLQV